MQIITIYQGASGSGEEIGGAVAEALGYATVDREVVVEASRQYGIPEAKLAEIVDREPTWWTSFTRNLEPYRIALQAAFCQLAGDRGMVYHGHIGHELIPKFQHVLKALLTAPIEMRIAQVRARQQLTEIAARRYVGGSRSGAYTPTQSHVRRRLVRSEPIRLGRQSWSHESRYRETTDRWDGAFNRLPDDPRLQADL